MRRHEGEARMITAATLDNLLGREITTICEVGYENRNDNHCAHFVSHVLGYQFGFTCRGMVAGTGTPATIRVQELFSRCPSVGKWESRPPELNTCLVFITKGSNVDVQARTMVNVPRKHVGIFIGGSIWHYSNSRDKVVKQTPQEFSRHYAPPDNAMFFGALPS
jgi:hypothetical protein